MPRWLCVAVLLGVVVASYLFVVHIWSSEGSAPGARAGLLAGAFLAVVVTAMRYGSRR